MKEQQLKELILQSLEHEMGGVTVYETAVQCAVNDDLREEWEKYLDQTRTHVQILREICESMQIDAEEETTGRSVVRTVGTALVDAMKLASERGNQDAAQLVACEAVVLAETKDHLDWELLGKCAKKLKGPAAKMLQQACEQVEDEEDEHLYHTAGWARELWIDFLGMPAVMPPPEEEKDVKTAIGAARAKQARTEML